ncbi:MAG: hypothetical protein KBS81_11870, partial [Spirochaetales bacterium]|nr:hypothetical protein [Candidatus Physcosoma equi]
EYPDLTSVLVLSQNKEILAALGTMDEGTLRTMVYSISSDEETVLNQHPLEDDIWENTTPLGSYLVYVDAKNKEAVMNNLHLSFSRNGKI